MRVKRGDSRVLVLMVLLLLLLSIIIDPQVRANGIKSTRPTKPMAIGAIKATTVVIKKTSPPVHFKSISMSELRPVIHMVRQQQQQQQHILTFSFYDYKEAWERQ